MNRKNPDLAVSQPNPQHTPTAVGGSNNTRSLQARGKRFNELATRRMSYFEENVTIIKVPFTLEDMDKNVCYEDLETICNSDLAQVSPQCFSAKFIDKNDEPILFYFGFREKVGKDKKRVRLVWF